MSTALELNYKKYGDSGPSIIILHGFLGSLDNWHTIAAEWGSMGYTVYTVDQRNHGKSPHSTMHSIELMASDLFHFIKVHQILKPIILGHSMGGKVAMQITLNHPLLVEKLIVVDIAPRAYKPGAHDAVFKAIFAVDLALITNRKEAEAAMMPYLGDFGTRQFILKSLERTPNGFEWKFNIQTLYDEYDEAIKGISSAKQSFVPTLFIKGSQSLYIQDTDIHEIKELFPNSIISEISNAGHWVHADQPKLLTELVKKFLDKKDLIHLSV